MSEHDLEYIAKDKSESSEPESLDSEDPMRWSWKKKHSYLAIVSLIAFLPDFGSSISIPLVLQQAELWSVSPNVVQRNLSGNLITLGIGGFFVISFALYFGRLPVTVYFLIVSIASSIWCALATSLTSYIAARCVNGFFITIAQAGGLMWVQDLFEIHEHPRKINILSASIILSPYIGPLVGSFVAWRLSWRWSFWILTILTGATLLVVLFFLDETYYPRDSVQKGYREISAPRSRLLRILGVEQRKRGLMDVPFNQAALRPLLAGLKLPVFLLSVYYFLNFGWVVGVNATVGLWLESIYGFDLRASGFFYFAGIVGILIGWLIGHYLYDCIGDYYSRRYGITDVKPEVRLVSCYLGAPLMFAALVLLGFGLANKWHYMVLAVCYGLQDTGMLIVTVSVNAYLLQLYPDMPGEVATWINIGRSAGGCMAVYAQIDWIERAGPKATLGAQGAIVMASLIIILFLQLFRERYETYVKSK